MSQRRFVLPLALLAIVGGLIVALPALAESSVRIVHLSYIDGDAQVTQGADGRTFSHAVLNMPVMSGMWVYTPQGGRAEVQFENGSTVRVANDAEIQFTKLALADSGGKIDAIRVDHGIAYFNFDKVKPDDHITIDVGGRTFHVTKAARLRVEASKDDVKFALFHGEATADGDHPMELKGHETVSFAPVATTDAKVAKGSEKLETDNWNKDRDNDLAVLSNQQSPLSYPKDYNAQFSYLGAYGNYFDMPGYGYVWQPFGMGAGWDPFMNGLWGFYPGMGYTWISSYPWGWAPYRYGSWNFMSQVGWFWAPGSNFNAFNVGPQFGVVPAGWRAPVPPAGGKSAQLIAVGHPPNVHPAILTGHALIGAHPDTRMVAASVHARGSAAPPTLRPEPGTVARLSPRFAPHAEEARGGRESGGWAAAASSTPAHSSAPTSGGGGGHPK